MRKTWLAVLMLLLPTLVFAQAETTGRVTGRVVDESGNPLVGATITVESPALQGQRTVQTDANGRYTLPLLPSGAYTMTVASEGLMTAEYQFRVGIGQTIPLDVPLKKGPNLVEEVTVFGNASKLETTVLGENFNYEEQIDKLPVVNREIERVAELGPNISFGPTPDTLSISGAPSFDTTVLLDGAEISDPYFGSAPPLYIEEAVEEVQVMTSGISAKYGRFQGGVINATTKSGGNEFDGAARIDLSKQSWNEQTPINETQSDTLNKTYSASLGGPIVKDRLWFFVGGRTIPTQELALQTALTAQSFVQTTDEDRWQVKLTGNVTPDHVIEASYLNYDRSRTGAAGLPAADLRAQGDRDDPREIITAEYQGIFSDRTFFNVQATQKRVSIQSGGDPAKGDPFLDFYGSGFQIWHNHWWDFDDASDRDNDTIGASMTHVLSSGDWGDHTLEYGVQYVNSKTGGENRQSSTGFNLLNYDAVVSGNDFSNLNDPAFDPADPRFNLISYSDPAGGLTYRWEALPLGGGQELKNTALYVQDTWQRGRWRVDAGVRYETYEGEGPQPTLNMDFDAVSPRLGVTYNLDNNWQIQATWGKYVSRFNDNVASAVSGVGGAPYIVSIYTGPTACALGTHCLTYDQVQTANRDDANWGIISTITDPEQPTRFLADDIGAPYAQDLNLSVKRALPRNTGTVTLTFTDRSYKDLLDDFVGDQGVSNVVDPKGSGAEFQFDTEIWQNAGQAHRDYQSLTATFDYRPSDRWGLGGNWTFAETRGNYEGEGRNTPSSGSIIGDYVRSVPQTDAVPDGYLNEDIRHRVRLWGSYRFDFGRAGNLTLGSVGLYQSGTPFSKTASVAIAADPAYLNEGGKFYTHFFDGRGNNRFNGFWRVDLSTRYQIQIAKSLNFFAKLDIINVSNEDQLVTFNTSGSSAVGGNGLRVWTPSATFGQARNNLDYQTPRSYFVSAGLQW